MFRYLKLFFFLAMMLFSFGLSSQVKENKIDSIHAKTEKDTLIIMPGDTITKKEQLRYDPHYFDKTFTYSQELNDEYVAVKKGKYVLVADGTIGDILEKMPTVYDLNGDYYVQGKKMSYSLMNLYTVFHSNSLAINDFPENFIANMHLFEDPSFLMSFSYILDDNADQAIDYVTDVAYSENSWFGRFYGGWGIADMWDAGVNMNYFNGNSRLTFTAQSNNVNKQPYSTFDMSTMMSTETAAHFDVDGTPDNQTIADQIQYHDFDQSNGINRDFSTGIRYFNMKNNFKYYFNYFYNTTKNETDASLDYFYNENNMHYSEQAQLNSTNNVHRINGRLYYIKDKTFLRITPSVDIQNLNGSSSINAALMNSNSFANSLGNNDFYGCRPNLSFDFSQSFKKEGRNLVIDFVSQYNTGKNDYNNIIQLQPALQDTFLEQGQMKTNGAQIDATVAYTEPIGSKGLFQLLYVYGYKNNNFKKLSDYSDTTVFYAGALESASMRDYETKNRFMSHTFGILYQYNKEQWQINAGIQALLTYVKQEATGQNDATSNTTAIYPLPVFNFRYNINNFSNLKIAIKSYGTAPGLLNMQETFIMSNPLNASYGNSNLKYTWSNTFNARYNRFNRDFSSYFFTSLGANYSNNYVGTAIISEYDKYYNPDIVQSYITVVTPENMDRYFNITPYVHYTWPLARIKSMFDIDVYGQYAHVPAISNGQKGFSNQFRAGGGFGLKSGINDRIDFVLSTYTTYNYNFYTWDRNQSDQYVYQRTKLKINLLPWKRRILLQTDLAHNFTWGSYSAYKETDRNGFFLWNLSAGYKFLQDRSLTLKCTVHDILNQNQNIYQYTTSIYSESIKTNDLKRYFMISLVYDLNKLGRSQHNAPEDIIP